MPTILGSRRALGIVREHRTDEACTASHLNTSAAWRSAPPGPGSWPCWPIRHGRPAHAHRWAALFEPCSRSVWRVRARVTRGGSAPCGAATRDVDAMRWTVLPVACDARPCLLAWQRVPGTSPVSASAAARSAPACSRSRGHARQRAPGGDVRTRPAATPVGPCARCNNTVSPSIPR